MTQLRVVTAIAVGISLTVSLSSCSAVLSDVARQSCIDVITEYVHSEAEITETLVSPAGSIDWRGSFDGGTFACAGADDTDEVFQALVYYDDGRVETVIV